MNNFPFIAFPLFKLFYFRPNFGFISRLFGPISPVLGAKGAVFVIGMRPKIIFKVYLNKCTTFLLQRFLCSNYFIQPNFWAIFEPFFSWVCNLIGEQALLTNTAFILFVDLVVCMVGRFWIKNKKIGGVLKNPGPFVLLC